MATGHIPWIFCLSVITFCIDQCVCVTNPCSSRVYKILPHDKRVVTYTLGPTESEECDRYLHSGSNWYRLDGTGPSDLVTQCPDLQQCGSLFPIWLKGSIPRTSDGIVTRTACLRGITDCCETKISIKIKNCGAFRVTYLPTLQKCPGKYCFQYKEKCPPGQSSATGFMPCSSKYPHLPTSAKAEVVPFIGSHDLVSSDRRLFFRCNRIGDASKSTCYFDVHWFINGKEVKEFNNVSYSAYNKATVLGEDKTWKLPMDVKCSYSAKLYRNGVPSTPVTSDEFFAGIKVDSGNYSGWKHNGDLQHFQDGVVYIKEGQSALVHFTSTIPLPCVTEVRGRPLVQSCEINFENSVNQTHGGCSVTGPGGQSSGQIHLGPDCGFTFNGQKWNSAHPMSVKANSDGRTGTPTSPSVIRLSTNVNSLYPLWNNYKLPEIKVLAVDANKNLVPKVCRAFTDVIYDPFDGGRYMPDITGWFLLYRNRDKPIEIQTVTERKSYYGTSQCAISIKAGSDVFLIDICNNSWVITRKGCEHGKNLEVYEKDKGKTYLVVLPTGTKVNINFYNDIRNHSIIILNVNIYPSPEDVNRTEGMCGNFNGMKDYTDLPSKWKLGDTVDSVKFSQGINNNFQPSEQICLCAKHNTKSSMTINGVVCDWRTGVACTRMKWNDKACAFLHKRDTHLDEEGWTFPRTDENTHNVERRLERSTWTKTAARVKCLDVFRQYRSYNKCVELPEVDADSVLDGCAEEVVRSGTTYWIPGALEMVKSQCVNVLDMDTSLWTTSAPGVPSVGQTIFEEAKCPSECHGHGHCVRGVCKCDAGYVEEDCFVNLNVPPTIRRLSRDGVCDLSSSSCMTTHVYGDNFYDSSKLKCRVTELLIDTKGVKTDKVSILMDAKFENYRQVTCQFPEETRLTLPQYAVGVRGYRVEVSNNGVTYSSVLNFIARDPKCHDCDMKSMKCKLKDQSCYIDGLCYIAGEERNTDEKMKCNPAVSGFTWTDTTVVTTGVRLVGGHSNLEGRVELRHNGVWGTICQFYFDDKDAEVICRMLGYDATAGKAKTMKNFGGGSGPVWFDDPDCSGQEKDITECPRYFGVEKWGITHCKHSEDVGVKCTPKQNPAIVG